MTTTTMYLSHRNNLPQLFLVILRLLIQKDFVIWLELSPRYAPGIFREHFIKPHQHSIILLSPNYILSCGSMNKFRQLI